MRRNIPFLITCGGGFRLREWGFYVLKRRGLIYLHSDLGTRVEYGFFEVFEGFFWARGEVTS